MDPAATICWPGAEFDRFARAAPPILCVVAPCHRSPEDRPVSHPADGSPNEPPRRPATGATSPVDDIEAADRPLPPLPDGGLAASMPDWLREAPPGAGAETVPSAPSPTSALEPPRPPDAIDPIDPTTFLTEDDLPVWIRGLVAGSTAPPPTVDRKTGDRSGHLPRPAPKPPVAAAPRVAFPTVPALRSADAASSPVDGGGPGRTPAGVDAPRASSPTLPPALTNRPAERPPLPAALGTELARTSPTRRRDAAPIALALLLLLLAVLAVLVESGAFR